MANFSSNGCTPPNPGPEVTEITLIPTPNPDNVASIKVKKGAMPPPIQGTIYSGQANIYLNDTAFTGFRLFVANHAQTTVQFVPKTVIESSFAWF